ncbi:MAG: MoaD/ThiS family protein [Pseudomonadota bacterium]
MAEILYFGKLQDITGFNRETRQMPADVTDTIALRKWLDQRFASAGLLLEPTVRIAINSVIASEPADVCNSDEIALMPPVGGG